MRVVLQQNYLFKINFFCLLFILFVYFLFFVYYLYLLAFVASNILSVF